MGTIIIPCVNQKQKSSSIFSSTRTFFRASQCPHETSQHNWRITGGWGPCVFCTGIWFIRHPPGTKMNLDELYLRWTYYIYSHFTSYFTVCLQTWKSDENWGPGGEPFFRRFTHRKWKKSLTLEGGTYRRRFCRSQSLGYPWWSNKAKCTVYGWFSL